MPESIPLTRTAEIDSLIRYGFPAELVGAWASSIPRLNQLQVDAINEFSLLESNHLVVSAPTSSGKTMVGELAALWNALDRKRAIFLLPLKALVYDKHQHFTRTDRTKRTVVTVPATPPQLGRGGPRHKRIQDGIKRCGEDRGYLVTIEQPVLDGAGSVDVALSKDTRSIACEISVTSTPDQELGNIRKCLAAGFDWVALISQDEPFRNKIREQAGAELSAAERERVLFLPPEEFPKFLDELGAPASTRSATRLLACGKGLTAQIAESPVTDTPHRSLAQQ